MKAEVIFNSATFREQWGLREFVEACAARQLHRAGIWGVEIAELGIAPSRELLGQHQISVLGYNRTGPFLAPDSQKRQELMSVAKAQIDAAIDVGAEHILVFPGGLAPGATDLAGARHEMEDSIGRLLEHARQGGMTLALEPLHPMLCGDRTCLTSLRHANDICADLGGDHIGVVIDAYHVWWDETLASEIARAGRENSILSFHVNDWLVPTTHLLTDRGMMGDGIIDLAGMWQLVQAAGYAGPIEVEIFSERWWREDPGKTMDLALERCREIFADPEEAYGTH